MERVGRMVQWAVVHWLAIIFTSMAHIGAGSMGSSNLQQQAGCRLTVMGSGQGGFQQAAMSCAGTQATVALNPSSLGAYQGNFKGVNTTTSCGLPSTQQAPCLITICSGALVLRDSRVSGVQANPSLQVLLCVAGSSRLEVYGSQFSSNKVRPLAVVDQATVVLHGSTISDSVVAGSKPASGVVWVDGAASLTMTARSRVYGNRVEVGSGGLRVQGRAHVTIDGGSSVSNNTCGGWGGGLEAWGNATVLITDGSSVHGNTAINGSAGGVWVGEGASVTITGGSSVHSNTACQNGGGAFAEGSAKLTIANSSVHSNRALQGSGAGVYAQRRANVVLTSSSVYGNRAGDMGGGVYVQEMAQLTVTGSKVHGNTANARKGNEGEGCGGGLAVDGNATAMVTGSSLHGNAAYCGGGLVMVENASVVLTNHSAVYDNAAFNGSGGGVDVVDWAVLRISGGCIIANNSCMGCIGGGIAVGVRSDVSLMFGGLGRLERGIEDASSQTFVTISGSVIANNTSTHAAGGGLAITAEAVVKLLDGTRVVGNNAINGSAGAAMVANKALLQADSSVVFDNNRARRGNVGSSIAVWDSADVSLPARATRPGQMTKCNASVYLGRTPCGEGETLQHDVCLCCPPHTVAFDNHTGCLPCPPNADCLGANVVVPLPGFWSSAPTSVQMHRCPLFKTACDYVNRTSMCKPGYQGPLCGNCQLPEYGMLSPMRCSRCMRPSVQLGLYLLCGLVMVVFVACTVHTTWHDNLQGSKGVLVTSYVKILVQFLQYVVIVGSCSVPWPLFDVQQWLQAVDVFVTVGSGQAFSLDCLLHSYAPHSGVPLAIQRHLVLFLAPLCTLAAVVALQCIVIAVRRWVLPAKSRTSAPPAEAEPQQGVAAQAAPLPAAGSFLLLLRKLPVTCLVLVYYAYPTLLRASLSFFACLDIDRPVTASEAAQGITAPLSHEWGYWVSSIDAKCFAGWHLGWSLGLGLPMVLLWCVGVPVGMGVGLYVCRARADTVSFREHFGFLYRTYRPERMWWEAVWASRTVVLTLISVFAFPMQRYFSVLSLLLVFFVSAALQLVCKPYEEPALHRMHLVSTSCLAVTTMGALAMFAYDIQESTAFGLRIAITALVFSLNLAFVVVCCIKLAPGLKEWAVTKYASAKVWVPEVVEGAMECVGQPARRRGRRRQRRPSRFRGV